MILYGNTGYGVFKGGIQNWKGFWLNINCGQMKLSNLEVVKKFQNLTWLSKSIFYVKNHLNFSDFFPLEDTNLGANFLLLTFFDKAHIFWEGPENWRNLRRRFDIM